MNYELNENSLIYYQKNGEKLLEIGFFLINNEQTYVIERCWKHEHLTNDARDKIWLNFLKRIIDENKTVLPLTPFAQSFFKIHMDYNDLLFNK